ncbi:lactate utilization protein C [Streptomonospora nanhaiensis]|uniref:L-lactate dehydrogenase complex protein LldG n=1 Tax=Streptomonospora nanhaiensis TaxID=1323731 RepID=A0A853BHS1_9ACTN|nr:LUD domain-containing protein [Streptomonospora nanhaiensis]MBV2363373.1 LUD domain-containing protein [Streptomonospora nanhaiensis]MBX9389289.1 LUD domain-containing protein [Streptomonospora nanhaiensis]NYI94570.1 L-lactate dehydrogenase complex protein LldG [Streptomonospora nanhaiensis]
MADGRDAARAQILARVRRAAAATGSAEAAPGGAGRVWSAAGTEGADAVALFTDRLARHGIGVQHVTDLDDLPRVIASSLWGYGVRRVVVPRDLSSIWLSDLDGVWAMRDDPPHAPLSARAIESAGAAVTRCALAVADTGTLVLDGGIGQGRRALSLLPAHHLCVVESGQIVDTMATALAELDPARPTTWLTGLTSTTAIDGVPVGGVHGPQRLDVVIVG